MHGSNANPDEIPGANDDALRRPPRRNEPRTRTLTSRRGVNWCRKYGEWGDHLRADHPVQNANVADGGDGVPDVDPPYAQNVVVDDNQDEDVRGAFARLRAAGLL